MPSLRDPGESDGIPIPVGKLPAEILTRMLGGLGSRPPEVLLGPSLGEDACALELPGCVLVASTDPITLVRRGVGRHAVAVNANDVAVTGARPRWFLATLLLPPGATDTEVEAIFSEIVEALDDLGASLVGGHTEITPAVSQPLVVGQMLGLTLSNNPVTTSGARPGDVVVQIGAAPVEGAAVLAAECSSAVGDLDTSVVAAAALALDEPGISVVEAALAAAELGATAMHDPTEGGVAAGLHELAAAAGVHIRIDRAELLWFEPGLIVCNALGADPLATLASGSLLATFSPSSVSSAYEALRAQGFPLATIGIVEAGDGVSDSEGLEVPWPSRDEVCRVLEARPADS